MRSLHRFRQSARRGPWSETRNRTMRKGLGFTLVEMLVAMALSLIIILAVTQVFRLVGDSVLAGRAVVEMSGQLRSAADQLQRDLGGITVPVRPGLNRPRGPGTSSITKARSGTWEWAGPVVCSSQFYVYPVRPF